MPSYSIAPVTPASWTAKQQDVAFNKVESSDFSGAQSTQSTQSTRGKISTLLFKLKDLFESFFNLNEMRLAKMRGAALELAKTGVEPDKEFYLIDTIRSQIEKINAEILEVSEIEEVMLSLIVQENKAYNADIEALLNSPIVDSEEEVQKCASLDSDLLISQGWAILAEMEEMIKKEPSDLIEIEDAYLIDASEKCRQKKEGLIHQARGLLADIEKTEERYKDFPESILMAINDSYSKNNITDKLINPSAVAHKSLQQVPTVTLIMLTA